MLGAMYSRSLAILILATTLTACSTGGGGTVLPSPIGDIAVSKACREAAPDILPATPIKAASIWYNEGVGSAADSLELLRMGFERASFTASTTALAQANALPIGDTSRWSKVPLSSQAGKLTLEVAPYGDGRCLAFEREVAGQRNSGDPKANTDDPMKYWTDTRYPPAPPEGRNWCIATLASADEVALNLTRTVTSSREGQSNVSVTLETLTDPSGTLRARRTLVRMSRPSFPIGISQVSTGCDGREIGVIAEFWGQTGIALQPAAAPTLINR
jgi:hypothetical protein